MTLIGPKPTDTPTFNPPFRAEGDTVYDAEEREFATTNPDYLFDEIEHEMAQAIADALNEKFGGEPAKTTVTAEVFDNEPGGDPETAELVWFIVHDKAYFRDEVGVVESSFSPGELRDESYEFYRLGTREIDPAALAGVEGVE